MERPANPYYDSTIQRLLRGERLSPECSGVIDCYYEYCSKLSDKIRKSFHSEFLALYPSLKAELRRPVKKKVSGAFAFGKAKTANR